MIITNIWKEMFEITNQKIHENPINNMDDDLFGTTMDWKAS
jgi:hypothetical protein